MTRTPDSHHEPGRLYRVYRLAWKVAVAIILCLPLALALVLLAGGVQEALDGQVVRAARVFMASAGWVSDLGADLVLGGSERVCTIIVMHGDVFGVSI